MEELTTPYNEDLALIEKLRLVSFEAKHQQKTFIGIVETEQYEIEVYVECWPAQFWTFEIQDKEEPKERKVLTTGSGSLTEYWPIAEKFATGLLNIHPITQSTEF